MRFTIMILAMLCTRVMADKYTPTYTYEHPSCNISIYNQIEKGDFKELVEKLLKDRSYNVTYLKKSKRIIPGDLHIEIKKHSLPAKMWKDCVVEAKLRFAKTSTASNKDEILYKRKVKRQFPRLTLKGEERCKRALKDVFVHIPHCIGPKRR